MISDFATTKARLANDAHMPMLGFGTWKMSDSEAERVVVEAFAQGYRHVDTAEAYENEAGVGKGIKASGLSREEIFLTTKCWNDDIRQGYEGVLAAGRASVKRLGVEYVDLYLLHWPILEHDIAAWRAMEMLHTEGLAKAIGVSNYHIHHFDHLLPAVQIMPMVNQVEFHPLLLQNDLRAFCREHAIVFEAWSPIMQGKADDHPIIAGIAGKHGKTATQIVLRWDLQHGVVTIPKSSNAKRLAENRDIFDFELSTSEMAAIDALDKHQRIGPDPDNFGF